MRLEKDVSACKHQSEPACMFVDVILVSALFNRYDYCYQNSPQKAGKEGREGKVKEAITIKKKGIVEKYEWCSCDPSC